MPKNPGLEYQASEPAFLRRLKAGHAALDDRHNVQIPRARGGGGRNDRLKMDGDEGEDDPIMLDETGNEVSKEDMEAMRKPEATADSKLHTGEGIATDDVEAKPVTEHKPTDANVASGFGKKRKAAKVIGDDGEQKLDHLAGDGNDAEDVPVKSMKRSTKDLQAAVEQNKEEAKRAATEGTAAKKGKRKKVKLSFDDPE
ncbi:hypothetical protein H2198_004914 [Neophaeococcomyces mojaviensis]|uniref:Uncharacterized protein n=1 Tax=Neophaeococcomyces mojaviensis TaxID=3383035 RepID=A0ACC3A724_9EURO|nr:hypothetical protein H2198_004914 [Knufia sp. JES_112]